MKRTLTGILSLTMVAAMATSAWSNDANDAASTPVLEIKGTAYTAQTMNEFMNALYETEGQQAVGPQTGGEFVLAAVWSDLYTTAPALAAAPLGFSIAQRNFLEMKLRAFCDAETTVTDSELDAWVAENAQQYERAEQVKARHLFMGIDADSETSKPETVAAKIADVRKDVMGGTAFTEAVAEYSEAGTREAGGDMGYRTYRQEVPFRDRNNQQSEQKRPINLVLDNAMFALTPGDVSPVLQTAAGYHLLYCDDRLTTHLPSTAELVTSGILPNAVVSKKSGDLFGRISTEAAESHGITGAELGDEPTTGTPFLTIGKKTYSVSELGEMFFGPSLDNYFAQVASDKDAIEKLQTQLITMLSAPYAALDRKLQDKSKAVYEALGKRDAFKKTLETVTGEYSMTDEQVKEFFDANLDSPMYRFRTPEYEGYVVTLRGTEDEAKEMLKKLAELDGESMEAEIAKVSGDERKEKNGKVEMHKLGALDDMPAKQFDMFAQGVEVGQWIAAPQQLESGWLVIKVTAKGAGETIDFDGIKERLKQHLVAKYADDYRKAALRDAKTKDLYKIYEAYTQMYGPIED